MMAHIIEIPFHIGDFLSSTMHMDATEVGAFWMLCVAHYQIGIEGLPDDDKQLSRIAKVTPKVWARIRPIIEKKFDVIDGFWIHKKVVEVSQKIHSKSAENSAKSLKRWDTPKAKAFPLQSQPKTINQEPIKKEKNIIKKEMGNFEEFWKLCPRKVGKLDAEKKYIQAVQMITPEKLHEAMKAHAKEMKDREVEFIPHPSTWLNQGRFYDQNIRPQVDDEKEKWPAWKQEISLFLGDQIVSSWFKDSDRVGNKLFMSSEFAANFIRERHTQDLKRAGVDFIETRPC